MVSTLDLANVDVDGIPAIDLRQHSHADRCIPPADRFRPVFRYVTKNGCFAPQVAVSADQAVLSSGNTRHAVKESRSAFDDSYALAGCHGSGRAGLEETRSGRWRWRFWVGLAVHIICFAADSRHQAAPRTPSKEPSALKPGDGFR